MGSVLISLVAFGQERPNQPAEVRASVVDGDTGQPIAGAEIFLSCAGSNPTSSPPANAAGASGPDGSYVFKLSEPGSCRVYAKKAGYSDGTPRTFLVTGENSTIDAPIKLSRLSRVVGRLVDDETGEPLAGVAVQALKVFSAKGRMDVQRSGAEVRTDAEGRFAIPNVPPGDRVVFVDAQVRSFANRIRVGFTDRDFAATDRDVLRGYLPGGGTLESALPLPVSGGEVDLGSLRVKRATYYRVRLSITPGSCGSAERVTVFEATQPMVTMVGQPRRCGDEMLITGFPPGPHSLTLLADDGRGSWVARASVPFVIKEENLTLTATLGQGMDVEGRFLAAEDARLPELAKLRIDPRSRDTAGLRVDRLPAPPDAQGRFRLAGLISREYDLLLSGIGQAHYVAEVRYNGRLVARNVPNPSEGVPISLEQGAQVLEIVLDDKPAAISGRALRGDDPAPNPYVLLLQSAQGRVAPVVVRSIGGDDKGRFTFAGLPPGEYRLAAVTSEAVFAGLAPGALVRLSAEAAKVNLGRNEFKSIDFKLDERPL